MSTHESRIIYDPTVVGRPWGSFCETCGKLIGACQTEQDAKDVAENHQQWQKVKADFDARITPKFVG